MLAPVGIIFVLTFFRLIYFQLDQGAEVEGRVLSRVMYETEIEAPRGKILDRHGAVLAEDRGVWALEMDEPAKLRRHLRPGMERELLKRELTLIAEAAGVPLAELAAVVLNPKKTYAVLADDLSSSEHRRLAAILRTMRGSGIKMRRHWRRVYPQGRALAHMVGLLVDHDGKREGVLGLEAMCQDDLHGQDGSKASLGVAGGRGINPALGFQAAQEAPAVETTLDSRIGAVLLEQLDAVQLEHNPDWVAGVVVDVRTGDLLAIGGLPDFNPNWPGENTTRDEEGHLLGLALPAFWPIEPGSTCKPFIVGRALQEGAIQETDTFSNRGGTWNIRKPPIRNASGVPDRPMTPREVLAYSSNIGAGQIGLKLGVDGVQRAFRDFAFWEPLGLSLREPFPGIEPAAKYWKGKQGTIWTVPSVSMGHQLQITPARLAYSFAALVNGGQYFKPRLFAGQPIAAPRKVLSEGVSKFLCMAMTDVVEMPHRVWLPRSSGFRWGGKSGTTQKLHESNYTSLFAAFGPTENPEIVVVIVADNPKGKEHYGSKVAGVAAGNVLRRSVELMARAPRSVDLVPASTGVMFSNRKP